MYSKRYVTHKMKPEILSNRILSSYRCRKFNLITQILCLSLPLFPYFFADVAMVTVFIWRGQFLSSMHPHASYSCGIRKRKKATKHQPKNWPWPMNPLDWDDECVRS